MNDPIVTISDVRALRFCMGGGRRMAATYNLSWDHFIAHGYPASVLEATNDPLLIRLATHARSRTANVQHIQ